jgi:ABC-type Fe3+/spermidine/putrescine transport system ATPase subunit
VDAYLSLTDVAKSYDGRQMAVADVTFEARKGEFITFLGPSGSGKTTTLMMISGFENPTAGTSPRPSRTSAISAWCFRTTRCFRT